MFFALNMTWTRCEVYSNLDFEPSEKEWRAARHWGGGVRCLGALHWKSYQRISASDWKLGRCPKCLDVSSIREPVLYRKSCSMLLSKSKCGQFLSKIILAATSQVV